MKFYYFALTLTLPAHHVTLKYNENVKKTSQGNRRKYINL